MSRTRLALVLVVSAIALLVLLGLTEPTNEDTDASADPPTTAAPATTTTAFPRPDGPLLRPADAIVEVDAGTGCDVLLAADGSCGQVLVGAQEYAWFVSPDEPADRLAMVGARTSPTLWDVLLQAESAPPVRVEVFGPDLATDGTVGLTFVFRTDDGDVWVEVVDPVGGRVVVSRDLRDAVAELGDRGLMVWARDGDTWSTELLVAEGGWHFEALEPSEPPS